MEWIARIFPFSVCELPCTNPASIYLIKVNNRKTRIMCEICLKLTISKHQNEVNGVVLLSLVLILNKFHVLFWCFHCWIGKGKCQLGSQKKKKFCFFIFAFCMSCWCRQICWSVFADWPWPQTAVTLKSLKRDSYHRHYH